jgi:competence ComEA-like helix-hairpin-helix protein
MEEFIEREQPEEAKVDLNTATAADLEALPGIGPTYARRIIEYRQQRGPFTDISQIKEVRGIGEALYARINDRLTVSEEIPEQVLTEEVELTGEEISEPAPTGEVEPTGEEISEQVPTEEAKPTGREIEPEIRATRPPFAIGGVWWELAKGLLIIVLSTLLGVAISLGVIYSYNGTLDFSKHRDAVALKAQAEELQRASASLRADLEAIGGRVDNLEEKAKGFEELKKGMESLTSDVGELSKDVKNLRAEVADLGKDVESLTTDVGDLEKDVGSLKTDVSDLKEKMEVVRQEAARFNGFLNALRDLLIKTQGTPVPTPTP